MRRSLFFAVAVAASMHVAISAQSPHGSSQKLQPGPNTNAAGGVVNPADPAALVKADVLLQRQNETVVAASSRNADHVLAAANDYRFIDFPDDPHFGGGQNFITRLIAKLFRRPARNRGRSGPGRSAGRRLASIARAIEADVDRQRLPAGPLDESPASKGSPTVQRSPLKDSAIRRPSTEACRNDRPGPDGRPRRRMHMVVAGSCGSRRESARAACLRETPIFFFSRTIVRRRLLQLRLTS